MSNITSYSLGEKGKPYPQTQSLNPDNMDNHVLTYPMRIQSPGSIWRRLSESVLQCDTISNLYFLIHPGIDLILMHVPQHELVSHQLFCLKAKLSHHPRAPDACIV